MEFDFVKLNCSIFSRCNFKLCRRRLTIFFERLYDSKIFFHGSISIHILSVNGMVVVPVDSLGLGFASAFDLVATTRELVGTFSSSSRFAKISVSCLMLSFTYLIVPFETLTQE